MKKITLSLFLILSSIYLVNAQNYSPYLLGKTYKYINLKDSTILTQKIDSFSLGGIKDDAIFYSRIHRNTIGAIEFNSGFKYNAVASKYIERKNEIIFFTYDNDTTIDNKTIFKTIAKINDIWKSNTLTNTVNPTLKTYKYLKYIGKTYYKSKLISDSAKVYLSSNDSLGNDVIGKIYLSKNYGFLNTVGFDSLYSIKELNLGERNPISYQGTIGDTILWGHTSPCTQSEAQYGIPTKNIILNENDASTRLLIKNNQYFIEYIKKGIFYLKTTKSYSGYGSQQYDTTYQENVGLIRSYYSTFYFGHSGSTCSDFVIKRKPLILGVDNLAFENLQIYPNPSDDLMNIEFEKNQNCTFQVYDLNGKFLMDFISQNDSTLKLNKGIYILKITNNNNSIYKKIIFN